MPQDSRRILAYDALRIFAIVTVVAIHTLMPYREIADRGSAVRVLDDVLHYAVPLFVFISGALVWRQPLPQAPGAYRAFLVRRGRVIALPYVFWALMFLGIYMWRSAEPASALLRAPGLLLTGHIWYHLYFIPMLLTFYVLTPLATRIVVRSPELLVALTYALRLFAGAVIAEAFRSVLGDLGWSYATHVVTHMPHMALGAWFAIRYPTWPPRVRLAWPLLLLAGFGLLGAASAGLLPLSDMPVLARRLVYAGGMAATVMGIALAALSLEPRLQPAATHITRWSALVFGVYFVHPLFLLATGELIADRGAERLWLNPVFPILVFVGVTAASFATTAVLARSDKTSWTVGLSGQERQQSP